MANKNAAKICDVYVVLLTMTLFVAKDPVIDFEVESQFGGRPIPQLTAVIIKMVNQSVANVVCEIATLACF